MNNYIGTVCVLESLVDFHSKWRTPLLSCLQGFKQVHKDKFYHPGTSSTLHYNAVTIEYWKLRGQTIVNKLGGLIHSEYFIYKLTNVAHHSVDVKDDNDEDDRRNLPHHAHY